MRLSWNGLDGILQQAEKRGLSQREPLLPTPMSVHEAAEPKANDYIVAVTDEVQSVADKQKFCDLAEFYALLSEDQSARLKVRTWRCAPPALK